MPINLKGYYVFISWQQGSEAERDLVFKTIEYFNYNFAIKRGFTFIPIDMRTIKGGYGRAQSRINLSLYDCDFLLMLFYNRLGSLPDQQGEMVYKSGTEEEYHKAVECLNNEKPMREFVVFFKEVPESQLKNPDEQLKNMMAFKEEIEKECKYEDYKNNLKDLIIQYLEEWLFGLEHPNRLSITNRSLIGKDDVTEDL